ncbi:MAG: cell division protein ZapA [Treponema sp.]|jgi:cell division protein ZapA (FtsZ GTPase activity inhibitor)|nr:cell division protein ZapA [Treponema sp.]
MSNSAIRIDVLGTSLTISADADPEYLESLLEQFKQHIQSTQQLTGLTDPLKLAVLSGFLICDELEKSKKQHSSDSPEAEKLTLEMINRLDEALNKA